jgi:ABC-type nickel/cobalt efflux system permease component RcnA
MRGRTPVLRRSRTQLAFAGESGAIVLGATPPHTHDGDASHDHAHASGAAHTHDHDADGDDHEDAAAPHKHGWGLAHSHRIPGQDGEPVTWRRLVGLGVFGGLLPCPSAIVVMLSAIALHRVEFGLLLIVFFSLGLAGVLTGIGFALVYSRAIMRRVPLLQRLADRASNTSGLASLAVRAFPTAGAAAVVVAGTLITLRAALAVSG